MLAFRANMEGHNDEDASAFVVIKINQKDGSSLSIYVNGIKILQFLYSFAIIVVNAVH